MGFAIAARPCRRDEHISIAWTFTVALLNALHTYEREVEPVPVRDELETNIVIVWSGIDVDGARIVANLHRWLSGRGLAGGRTRRTKARSRGGPVLEAL